MSTDAATEATPARATIDRRTFLGASAAAGVGLLAAGHAGAQERRPTTGGSGRARNLILMVSDGMSIGAMQVAARVHELERSGEASPWQKLLAEPGARTTLVSTESQNSEVTDSAAAASAWSIGRKVPNSRINVDEHDQHWEPILLRAHRAGLTSGLVSTTRITHATPAAFAANTVDRNDEGTIARQLLERNVDVLLGGGSMFVTDDLLGEFDGLRVVRDASQLASTTPDAGSRLVGIFSESHMAYEIDRSETGQPSLEAMSLAALAELEARDTNGFVLQIEGGRIDHAAHANDIGGIVRDQLAFERAVAGVRRWLAGRDDTLLIVTTDHGNAGPAMTTYNEASYEGLQRIIGATRSFERLMTDLYPGGERGPGLVADLTQVGSKLASATGVTLSAEEIAMFVRAHRQDAAPVIPSKFRRAPHHVLGSLIGNHTGVNFVSGNHTAEQVVQTVLGPGSDRFPGVGHLADTHDAMCEAIGIEPSRAM